jgi:Tol biopolymer transport system component
MTNPLLPCRLLPLAGALFLISFSAFASPPPQGACLPMCESLDSGGGNANGHSDLPSLSPDGDWVAFESAAPNLVPGDVNGISDVFLRQISTGMTLLVSHGPGGILANGESFHPVVSEDGNYVAFYSEASNISHNNDTNGTRDAFLYERAFNRVRRISISSAGAEANANIGVRGERRGIDISDDGLRVVYSSNANNLVNGDTNLAADIFLYEHVGQSTTRLNMNGGVQSNGFSQSPVISGDGNVVAYMTSATNQGALDTNGVTDIYYLDVSTLVAHRASISTFGAQANNPCTWPAINRTGSVIAFESGATSLVSGDTLGHVDVFLRDLVGAGATERVSLTWDGEEANNYAYQATLSADGKRVGFTSGATNLIPGGGGIQSVYLRDRDLGTLERWGENSNGEAGFSGSVDASLDNDGYRMAFASLAQLVPSDVNGMIDIYVTGCGPQGTSHCGGPSTLCPCANAGSAGRGCENSSSTGGALCQAFGTPSISADEVYLVSYGTGANVPVLYFQGEALLGGGTGLPFGDGVRCVGTNIQRLGVKIAAGGYAEYGTGSDTPISTQGAIGILGGTRYYQAWYRDTAAFCTPGSFNVSNAIEVVWLP